MDFYYEFSYDISNILGVAYGCVYVISLLFGILGYVLGSIGLYAIAKRRCIAHPWMAWVPLVNVWILGSVSDQYRYVTKGQVKSKRKVMLVLEIIVYVLSIVIAVVSIKAIIEIVDTSYVGTEEEVIAAVLSSLLSLLGLIFAGAAVAVPRMVFHYMAMYDLYTSVNPPYNVVFLVLSIFFNFLEPFFLFFNRGKDGGMPPRCDIPMEPIAAIDPVWET